MSILVIFTMLFCLAAFLFRKGRQGAYCFMLFAVLHLAIPAALLLLQSSDNDWTFLHITDKWGGPLIYIDRINGFFWLVESIVVLAAAWYNLDFMRRKEEEPYRKKSWIYHAALIGFVGAMDLSLLADNFGLVWVFIELSTLLSALLIAHHGNANALEATWKYVFLCSIGIAFAFTGIIFLLISTGGNLHIMSSQVSPDKLFAFKLALPFLIVGFGAKMGLSPVHNWLPDAHSEAPSPVSALLSAALLNCAFLPIYRIIELARSTPSGGVYAQNILLAMGFLSLLTAAVFIPRSVNFKRMLAYSSVENMGLIAIAAAIGSQTGMLLQLSGHSLIKCALFLLAGNIYTIYGTKQISEVRGLLKSAPATGWLFLAGSLAIMGFPPFMLFAGEFVILAALLQKSVFLSFVMLLLLTVILYGMGRQVLAMCGGSPDPARMPGRDRTIWPMLMLLILSLFFYSLSSGRLFWLWNLPVGVTS